MVGIIRKIWNLWEPHLLTGGELATNGDFSSATGWTAETGWAITGGVAVATDCGLGERVYRAVTLTDDTYYTASFDVTSYTDTGDGGSVNFYGAGDASALNEGPSSLSETGTLEYTFLSSGTSGTVGAIIKTAGSDLTIDNFSLKKTARVRGICQGKKGEILAALSDSNLYDMYSSATRKDNWYWVSKRLSMHHKTQNKRWYEVVIAYTGDGSGDDPGVEVYWDYDTNRTAISAGENEANLIRKQLGNDVSAVNHRLIQLKITAGDATTEVDSVGFTFRRFETLVDQGSA